MQWDVRLTTCRFSLLREWVSGCGPLVLVGADTSGAIMLCSSLSGGWRAPAPWGWGHWLSAALICDCGASTDAPLLLCLGVDSGLSLGWFFALLHMQVQIYFHLCVCFSVHYCSYFQNNKFTFETEKRQFPRNDDIWLNIFLCVLLVSSAPVRAYISPQNQSVNPSLNLSINQPSNVSITHMDKNNCEARWF